MEKSLHLSYTYSACGRSLTGFLEDGILYLRMRQLFTSVMRPSDEADKQARNALCAAVSNYVRHAGGAYGLDTDENGACRPRLYVSWPALHGVYSALDSEDEDGDGAVAAQKDLLARAMDAFEDTQRTVAAGCPVTCCEAEFRRTAFLPDSGPEPEPESEPDSESDPEEPHGMGPEECPADEAADCGVNPMAALAAAGAACAGAFALGVFLGRRR